jgi:hypothetical protein
VKNRGLDRRTVEAVLLVEPPVDERNLGPRI